MFIVRCRVSGGVTGTCHSIVKDLKGEVLRFWSLEEAENYARDKTQQFNSNPYRTATFSYWADREWVG